MLIEMPSEFKTRENIETGFKAVMQRLDQLQARGDGSNPEEMQNLTKQVTDLVEGQRKFEEAIKSRGDIWGGPRMEALEYPYEPDEDFPGMSRAQWNLTAFHPDELTAASQVHRSIYPGLSPSLHRMLGSGRERTRDEFSHLVEEMQALNDATLMIDSILYGDGQSRYARSGDTRRARLEGLKTFKRYKKVVEAIQRLATTGTTGTGTGADWLPVGYSAQLHDLVQLQAQVPGIFSVIDMPSKSYQSPVLKADGRAYLIPENVADTGQTAITSSQPQTTNMTLTAVKLAARMWTSTEAVEDLIVPVIPWLIGQLAKVTSRGIEEAIVSGDTTATHMDNAITGGVGSDDLRKAWNGLRGFVIQTTGMPFKDLSTMSDANLLGMMDSMGAYFNPSECAWIMSVKSYIKAAQVKDAGNNPLVMRADTWGGPGFIKTGVMGILLGSPIYLSDYMPDDTDATTGKRTAAGTKSEILRVHVPSFVRGNRRALTISRSAERHIEFDQWVFVSTWRGDFKSWWKDLNTYTNANFKCVALGYNI